jgi:hypothetical protein
MEDLADAVAQGGVAVAAVSGFVLLMARLARPWLGRRVNEQPLRAVVSTDPYEAMFLFFWRQRRWAGPTFVAGCILAVIGVIGNA